jgi:hypothetical protein
VDRGCRVVSATDPHALWSRFSRPEPLPFVQVAPQLSSRGWLDPVPDPLLLRKSGSAENRTRDLWICSQVLWPLVRRRSHYHTKTMFIRALYFNWTWVVQYSHLPTPYTFKINFLYSSTHAYVSQEASYCDVLLGKTPPVTEYTHATRELRMLFRVARQRSAHQAAGVATTAFPRRRAAILSHTTVGTVILPRVRPDNKRRCSLVRLEVHKQNENVYAFSLQRAVCKESSQSCDRRPSRAVLGRRQF